MGLPCSHKIQQCRTEDGCLRLNDFDPHWRFKAPTYSRVIPFLHIDDLAIDPLLQVANPPVARPCGRPVGSVNKPSRCKHEHVRSTRRNPSEFERVNVEKARPKIMAMWQAAVEQHWVKTTRGRGASCTSSDAGQHRWSHQTTYTEQQGCGGAGQWVPSAYTSLPPGHMSKATNKARSRGLYNSAE